MMDPLDVKLMNCASCGRAMLGPSMIWRSDLPPAFLVYPCYAEHVDGRPWCTACVEHERCADESPPCVSGKQWGRSFVKGDDGANTFEDVVRAWEEAE